MGKVWSLVGSPDDLSATTRRAGWYFLLGNLLSARCSHGERGVVRHLSIAEFILFRWLTTTHTNESAPHSVESRGAPSFDQPPPESCSQPPYVVLRVGATTRRNPICYPKVTAIYGKFLALLHPYESLVQDGSKAQTRQGQPLSTTLISLW